MSGERLVAPESRLTETAAAGMFITPEFMKEKTNAYGVYAVAVLALILGAVMFGVHAASSAGGQYSWYFQHEPTNALQLYYAATTGSLAQPIASFTSTGTLGIGTANPSGLVKLQVTGGPTTARIGIENIVSGKTWHLISRDSGNFAIRNATNNTQAIEIDPIGNVGIGVSSQTITQKLEVNGAVRFAPISAPSNPSAGTMYFDAATTHFFGFDGNGWKQLDN